MSQLRNTNAPVEGIGEPDALEDDVAGFAYERDYQDEHSWEQLQEDEHGNLRSTKNKMTMMLAVQRARRRRLLDEAQRSQIRRGMIRYIEIIIDLSRAASLTDMRPIRSAVIFSVVKTFIHTFFDENPLGQLGIIVLRDGVAQHITELSSSPERHIEKLKNSLDTSGSTSLQNGIDLAVDSLKAIPPYGHRECLIVLAALSTCDPGNINDSIKAAKAAKVRISVVGLAAEVHICRTLADATGGKYAVALGEVHLEELLVQHAIPPPAAPGSSGVSLIRMGFPSKSNEAPGTSVFVGAECILQPGAFICPQCKGRSEDLPTKCHICGLTLVLSSHLARSYHHLFPVKPFEELVGEKRTAPKKKEGAVLKNVIDDSTSDDADADADGHNDMSIDVAKQRTNSDRILELCRKGNVCCYGCSHHLNLAVGDGQSQQQHNDASLIGSAVFCRDCENVFCFDCDVFIHEHLHSCPGCECLPIPQAQ